MPINGGPIYPTESIANSSHADTDGSHAHQNQASAAVIFRNTHRRKSGKPGAWNLQGHITRRRDHGLRAAAVAVITRLSLRILLSKMMIQFSLQHPLRQPFLQLTRKPGFA